MISNDLRHSVVEKRNRRCSRNIIPISVAEEQSAAILAALLPLIDTDQLCISANSLATELSEPSRNIDLVDVSKCRDRLQADSSLKSGSATTCATETHFHAVATHVYVACWCIFACSKSAVVRILKVTAIYRPFLSK